VSTRPLATNRSANRRGEGEVARVEEAAVTARQVPGRERLDQAQLDRSPEVAGGYVDGQPDVQRHVRRGLYDDIAARHPVGLELGGQFGAEGRVRASAALPVDGDELGVPGAGPAPGADWTRESSAAAAALWPLDDGAAMMFQTAFYRELARDGHPPAALARCRHLAGKGALGEVVRAPEAWAGYVLYGI